MSALDHRAFPYPLPMPKNKLDNLFFSVGQHYVMGALEASK
jgi:hypothetical protein